MSKKNKTWMIIFSIGYGLFLLTLLIIGASCSHIPTYQNFPEKDIVYWSPEKGPVLIKMDKLNKVYQGKYWVTKEEWEEKMKKLDSWEREYDEKYKKKMYY